MDRRRVSSWIDGWLKEWESRLVGFGWSGLRVSKKLGRIDLVIDSSGLGIFGEGEWAAVKHGGKGIRGWKKLHLGVDGDGVIVGQEPKTPAANVMVVT